MTGQKSHTFKFAREVRFSLPEQLLSPPYDLRDEMTWVDFSSTENPLGTPASFRKDIARSTANGVLAFAPDRDAHTLRSVLARIFGLTVDHFLVGATPSGMIRAAAQAFNPCRVGVSLPCRTETVISIANAGHIVQRVESPAGFVTPDANTLAAQGIHIDAAVLANPSFPTSRLLSRSTLLSYLDTCDWVVVDERSIELTLGGETMASLVNRYPNLIVVQSFNEQYALYGEQVSYCIACPETIAHIANFFDCSCVTMIPEIIAEDSFAEHEKLDRVREFLDSEIPWLQCMLSLIPGITIYPAEANYVLCSFHQANGLTLGVSSAEELRERLQLSGFLVRQLDGALGLEDDGYFCVAVRTREDNEKLIAAIRKIVLPND